MRVKWEGRDETNIVIGQPIKLKDNNIINYSVLVFIIYKSIA